MLIRRIYFLYSPFHSCYKISCMEDVVDNEKQVRPVKGKSGKDDC